MYKGNMQIAYCNVCHILFFSTQEVHYIIPLIVVQFIKDRWNNVKKCICGEVCDRQISNDEHYYNPLSKQSRYRGQVEIAAVLYVFPNIK